MLVLWRAIGEDWLTFVGFFSKMRNSMQQFISKAMNSKAELRGTAEELLHHPWIAGYEDWYLDVLSKEADKLESPPPSRAEYCRPSKIPTRRSLNVQLQETHHAKATTLDMDVQSQPDLRRIAIPRSLTWDTQDPSRERKNALHNQVSFERGAADELPVGESWSKPCSIPLVRTSMAGFHQHGGLSKQV
jgi:serine/threonine protein kinase